MTSSRKAHTVVVTVLAFVLAAPARAHDDGNDGTAPVPGRDACATMPAKPITLPNDDAAHNDVYFEWWWWNGHLRTSDGRRLGFIVYFASKPLLGYHWVDYTITDLATGKFHYGREPMLLGPPAALEGRFALRSTGAVASGANGDDRIEIDLHGYELDLALKSMKPPALHFGDGHVSYYCNNASFYSRMRMQARGRLRRPGARRLRPVEGLAYFEHAWGNVPAIDIANWNHLGLRLDDGSDVFVGILRYRENGEEFSYLTGTVSDSEGRVRRLRRGDFEVSPTRYWQRDGTCRYPVEFDLTYDGRTLHVKPSLDAQELRATGTPEAYVVHNTPTYWDGEVVVGGDVAGRGYLDMARYCAA